MDSRAGDMFKIFGSAADENIIVRQVDGFSNATRFPFEMANVEFLKARGGDGFDDLVNYSGDLSLPSVRSLLEGQADNDILLGGITAVDDINSITDDNRNVDVIAAGGGADFLAGGFAGMIIDNGITPNLTPMPVPAGSAANRSDGDDFLFADVDLLSTSSGVVIPDPPGLGDLIDGGTGTNSVFQVGSLDIVNNATGSLVDGGACKNVLTWLRAQIIQIGTAPGSGDVPNDLVDMAFDELGFNWGVAAPSTSTPNAPVVEQVSGMRLDVNTDGNVTALDALQVINDLQRQSNSSGEAPTPIADTRRATDVNGDGNVTSLDALLVINHLSRRTDERGEGEGRQVYIGDFDGQFARAESSPTPVNCVDHDEVESSASFSIWSDAVDQVMSDGVSHNGESNGGGDASTLELLSDQRPPFDAPGLN